MNSTKLLTTVESSAEQNKAFTNALNTSSELTERQLDDVNAGRFWDDLGKFLSPPKRNNGGQPIR